MEVVVIVAVAENGVIGAGNAIPWRLPSDSAFFKRATLGKPVIMGRKTWDSLPKKPLPGRHNIIITRQKGFVAQGATVVESADAALAAAGNVPEVCVIGGGEVFDLFLDRADRIYLTEIDAEVDGDTAAPRLDNKSWQLVSSEAVPAGPADSASFTLKVLERAPN